MRTILARLSTEDRGLSTAEYAVGTCAAAGFGGLLYTILTSDTVQSLLLGVIQNAFGSFGG